MTLAMYYNAGLMVFPALTIMGLFLLEISQKVTFIHTKMVE